MIFTFHFFLSNFLREYQMMTRKVSHPDILSRPHGKSFFTGKYKSERWTIILVGFHWADGIKKLEFFCDIEEIVSTVFHISIICCHYIKCFFDWSEILTGDTEWQPQPRYLFERYICFRTRMNVAWNKEQGNDLIEEYFNDNDGK